MYNGLHICVSEAVFIFRESGHGGFKLTADFNMMVVTITALLDAVRTSIINHH